MSASSNPASTSSNKGLFPGYKHVESFGEDDEYEDEVEECYVTLDLSSVDQTLVPSSSAYRLIALDTPTPFLQLSGTIMKGHHQTLLGTELIFKDISDESESPLQNRNNIEFFAKTDQRILFREVQLKPKTDEPTPLPSSSSRRKNITFITPFTADEGPPRSSVSNAEEQVTQNASQPDVTSAQPVPDVTDTDTAESHNTGQEHTAEPVGDQSMDVDP